MKKIIYIAIFVQLCNISSLFAQRIISAERDSLTTKLHVIIEKPINQNIKNTVSFVERGDPSSNVVFFLDAYRSDYRDSTMSIFDTTIINMNFEYYPDGFPPVSYLNYYLVVALLWKKPDHMVEDVADCCIIDIGYLTSTRAAYLCRTDRIFSPDQQQDVQIFPNPACGKFTIQSEMNLLSVRVLDICGKELLKFNDGSKEISTRDLANGVYLVQI